MTLDELKGIHDGETVWVFGSGPSLNFLDKRFFHDKIVISTNDSSFCIGVVPQYMYSNYHHSAADLVSDETICVTMKRDTLSQDEWQGFRHDNVVLVEHESYHPPGSSWNPLTTHPPEHDSIAYGSSSLHGAMHLAAHLGASFIMLVGADCGTIDGHHRVLARKPGGDTLWGLYNEHHRLMKEWLKANYDVSVYSLNPFINFNLEGHNFEGVS